MQAGIYGQKKKKKKKTVKDERGWKFDENWTFKIIRFHFFFGWLLENDIVAYWHYQLDSHSLMGITRTFSINKSTSSTNPPSHCQNRNKTSKLQNTHTVSRTRSYGNGSNGSPQSLLLRQEPYSTIRQSHGTFLGLEIILRDNRFHFLYLYLHLCPPYWY